MEGKKLTCSESNIIPCAIPSMSAKTLRWKIRRRRRYLVEKTNNATRIGIRNAEKTAPIRAKVSDGLIAAR